MEGLGHFYEFVDAEIIRARILWSEQISVERDGDGEEYLSGPTDELWKLRGFPKVLYDSIFIALYTYLEIASGKLVKRFEANLGSNSRKCNWRKCRFKLPDWGWFRKRQTSKLDGLDGLRRHLKSLGVDLNGIDKMFQKMDYYRNIRNTLVHSRGHIRAERRWKNLIVEIKKEPSLHFAPQKGGGGCVSIVQSSFLKDFGVFIPEFLGQIFSKLYPEEVPVPKSPEK